MRTVVSLIVAVVLIAAACDRKETVKWRTVEIVRYEGYPANFDSRLIWGLWLEAWNTSAWTVGVQGYGWVLNASTEAIELRYRPVWRIFTDGRRPDETQILKLTGRYYAGADSTERRVIYGRETLLVYTEEGEISTSAYWGISWEPF